MFYETAILESNKFDIFGSKKACELINKINNKNKLVFYDFGGAYFYIKKQNYGKPGLETIWVKNWQEKEYKFSSYNMISKAIDLFLADNLTYKYEEVD